MLLQLIRSDESFLNILVYFLLNLPIIFLAISVHEASHAFVSYKLGDPTAKNLGRITLNPLKHIDPIGFLSMALLGFGWANPVQINTRYFKKPKRDMALSAFAGPVSNILLAFVCTGILKLIITFAPVVRIDFVAGASFSSLALTLVTRLVFYSVLLNLMFAVFNMLPVPPLDGSRVIYTFLPAKYYFSVMKYERYIAIAIIILLFLGWISPVLNFFASGIANLFFFIFQIPIRI